MTHPAHATNRRKAVEDMTVWLWHHLEPPQRRDPIVPHTLALWSQVLRNAAARQTGHHHGRDVSDETWAEVVQWLHRMIEAEIRVPFHWTGETECTECDGSGRYEVSLGRGTEACSCLPDLDRRTVSCRHCGERPAVLVIGDVPSCRTCRFDVLAMEMVGRERTDAAAADVVDAEPSAA